MIRRLLPVFLAVVMGFISGCSGLRNYARMTDQARLSISQGRFEDALAVYPESMAKGKDEVLIRLERATLLQAAGKYNESAAEFESAASRIREYEGSAVISATRTASQIGSLLLNEQVLSYEGEDYEKILIHALNSVNYLMRGDLEGARVEIRVAYQRQNELYEKHAKELEKGKKENSTMSWEKSYQDADRSGYDEVKKKADLVQSIYQNAFAYYVSSLVYELGKEDDEAYIDLKKGIQAAPWSTCMQKDLLRLSRKLGFDEDAGMWKARYGDVPKGYGTGVDVFVVFQYGLAPVKEQLNLPILLSQGGIAFASLPVYRFIPSKVNGARIAADDMTAEASMVSDIDAMAARNLIDEFPVIFAKQVVRTTFKASMTNKLSRDYGAIGAITGTLASAVSEQADLRSWTTLPKGIQVVRVYLPGKTRMFTLSSMPGGHSEMVEVPEGARHLIVFARDTDSGLTLRTKAY